MTGLRVMVVIVVLVRGHFTRKSEYDVQMAERLVNLVISLEVIRTLVRCGLFWSENNDAR